MSVRSFVFRERVARSAINWLACLWINWQSRVSESRLHARRFDRDRDHDRHSSCASRFEQRTLLTRNFLWQRGNSPARNAAVNPLHISGCFHRRNAAIHHATSTPEDRLQSTAVSSPFASSFFLLFLPRNCN